MTELLEALQVKYEDKYHYLRLKNIEVTKISKKIYVTFYVPEDIFDYEFESADAKAIKSVIEEALKTQDYGYKVFLYFEKIYYDEDILRSSLSDFILSNYPYVGANINFERVEMSVGEDINIVFVIQESVYDYAQKSGFENGVKKYLQSKYYLNSNITYEIIDNIESSARLDESLPNTHRSMFIPVKIEKTICGKLELKRIYPIHIAKIQKSGDNITICGKISMLECKVWDESKAIEGKRFYKYHYQFLLDDTSATIRVLHNTNKADCELKNLTVDTQVVVKGRIIYQERTGKYIMFGKHIALCDIDFDTVKAQLAPLEPPEQYRIMPQKYINAYQMQLDVLEPVVTEKRLGKFVVMHYLAIPKINDKIIYEIAMLKVIDGEFSEYYHSYVKAPKHEKMSFEVSTKVTIAPRITSIIPDIIKFTKGHTIVGLDVVDSVKKINQVAKPLRYIMQNELKEIFPESISKKANSFYNYCKINGLNISTDSTAMDYVRCIAELLIKTNN